MAWEFFSVQPLIPSHGSIQIYQLRKTTFKEFNQISWEFSIMKIVWQIGSFSVCMTISLLSQKQDRVQLI